MLSFIIEKRSSYESPEWGHLTKSVKGLMEDFTAKVTLNLRPEGWVGTGQRKLCRKSLPHRGEQVCTV